MATIYVIKFKFAGSGDLVWRKVINGQVSRNQQNDLFKIEEKNGNIFIAYGYEVQKAYGDMAFRNSSPIESNGKVLYILDKNAMIKKFGEEGTPAYIWIKTRQPKQSKHGLKNIIEITIPGPQTLGGASDTGSFSIKNNVLKSIPILEKWINEHISMCLEPEDKVYLKIKGHSRGGVAANIVLNKLSQEYGLNDKVEICAVTFDPVPGPLKTGPVSMSDRLEGSNSINPKEYEKLVLSDKVKGAVIYSVNTEKSVDFEPQKMYNYPVTIISEFDHSVGLYEVDEDKTHKKGYSFSGKTYRPGKLFKLPKGIYWAKKDFNLEVINLSNYTEKIDYIEKNGQNNRKKFLKNIIYNRILTKECIDNILILPNESLENGKYIEILNAKLTRLKGLFYKDKKIENLITNLLATVKEMTIPAKTETVDGITKPINTYLAQIKTSEIKKYFANKMIFYIRTIAKGRTYL